MKYMIRLRMDLDKANEATADPEFGKKMHDLLAEINAEAAYFTTINGQRGGYIVVNMNDASEMPKIAEPFFVWLKADIDVFPVMRPEDLAKAGPSILAAVQKWGK